MKFYDCSTAPSPRRVRIFIAEKGLDIPVQQVDLRNGEQLSATFRALNADCAVPVLQLDDGRMLSEVVAICQYLEEVSPDPRLMGVDAAERATVLMWNAKIEQQGLSATADAFRNSAKGFKDRALTGPHNYAQIPQLAERGMQRAVHFSQRLDELFASNAYVIGKAISIADISAFLFVEFASRLKAIDLDDFENLRRWHESVGERPAFQR